MQHLNNYQIFAMGMAFGAIALLFVIGLYRCWQSDRAMRRDYSPDLIRKLEDR